jgi:hypothetical protein
MPGMFRDYINHALGSTVAILILLTDNNEWSIMNCTFAKINSFNNQSELYLVLIYDYYGRASVCNNVFRNNNALYKGVVYFGPGAKTPQVLVQENVFYANKGVLGGAIFFERHIPSGIRNNYFIENIGTLYGHTFAGNSEKLVVVKNGTEESSTSHIKLPSGATFPTFGVAVQDLFWQTIAPSEFSQNFLVAYASVVKQLESDSDPKAATVSGFEQVMLQGQDAATFSQLQVVGLPGDYSLLILPRINFDPSRINARLNFTLSNCEPPQVMQTIGNEPYPRCIQRESLLNDVYNLNLYSLWQPFAATVVTDHTGNASVSTSASAVKNTRAWDAS